MARPIEPTPPLEGEDALRFLEEMERVDSLKPGDPEYEERKKRTKELEKSLKNDPFVHLLSRGFK